MSTRIQRLGALALIAAGAGTLGYAANGLAGTDADLRAAERGARAVEVRLGADDPGRPCPRDRHEPPAGVDRAPEL